MRARYNRQGTEQLPAVASLFDVDGAGIVVTAFKRAEDGDGVVARVYNTLNRASTAQALVRRTLVARRDRRHEGRRARYEGRRCEQRRAPQAPPKRNRDGAV